MSMVLSRQCPAILITIAIIVFMAVPLHAFWTVEGDGYKADTGGSIRTVGAGIRNYDDPLIFGNDNDYDSSSQTLLRLTSRGALSSYLSFEIHLVQEIFTSTAQTDALMPGSAATSPIPQRYRISESGWDWAEDDDFRASLDADRFYVQYSQGAIDLTVGRQAINFSQAYFFNPLDIFLTFDPETFDRDYKPGVDAVRADIELGSFSGLTFVAAPGRELRVEATPGTIRISAESFADESWYGSALMGRFSTNYLDWDLSIQAGKVYGGYTMGAGFAGGFHGMGIRAEAAYLIARGDSTAGIVDANPPDYLREVDLVEDHLMVVAGVDYRFANSTYCNMELLFNGAGDSSDLEASLLRSATGQSVSLGEYLAGLQLSYEFHPLLTGQIAWMYSFSDTSSLVSPTFTYSVADEAEFLCGATLGRGETPSAQQIAPGLNIPVLESEFGTYPDVFFLEFKFYF
ncbi:MAG: hypothetical protein JXM72_06835 [Deltaproteobacteria bacterium]|nr:hypothetical protein [Deltaproteobacteria bacterium]